eukprot:COSAG01_NODE_1724_length_9382_cov_6.435743_4_plen_113_part_00
MDLLRTQLQVPAHFHDKHREHGLNRKRSGISVTASVLIMQYHAGDAGAARRQVLEAHAGDGEDSRHAVSRPFPSRHRCTLTEIYLCHARAGQEILRAETAGQGCVMLDRRVL